VPRLPVVRIATGIGELRAVHQDRPCAVHLPQPHLHLGVFEAYARGGSVLQGRDGGLVYGPRRRDAEVLDRLRDVQAVGGVPLGGRGEAVSLLVIPVQQVEFRRFLRGSIVEASIEQLARARGLGPAVPLQEVREVILPEQRGPRVREGE
jgi:hypothetical protein